MVLRETGTILLMIILLHMPMKDSRQFIQIVHKKRNGEIGRFRLCK